MLFLDNCGLFILETRDKDYGAQREDLYLPQPIQVRSNCKHIIMLCAYRMQCPLTTLCLTPAYGFSHTYDLWNKTSIVIVIPCTLDLDINKYI